MVLPSGRRLVTRGDELLPVQGGADGTEERVLTLHTVFVVCQFLVSQSNS